MENPGPARERQRRRRLQQRSPPVLPSWVYDITVDEYGVFHPRPNCPGGPFRSRVEATFAIRCKHCRGLPGVIRVRLYGETMFFEGFPTPARNQLEIIRSCYACHMEAPNLTPSVIMDLGSKFCKLAPGELSVQALVKKRKTKAIASTTSKKDMKVNMKKKGVAKSKQVKAATKNINKNDKDADKTNKKTKK